VRQNYSYSKRQRELAKKQKGEEKLRRRLERKLAAQQGADGTPPEPGAEPATAESTAEPAPVEQKT
jgi:hypothetical protein